MSQEMTTERQRLNATLIIAFGTAPKYFLARMCLNSSNAAALLRSQLPIVLASIRKYEQGGKRPARHFCGPNTRQVARK